jgi:uncharacterized protein (TIGR01777 family)
MAKILISGGSGLIGKAISKLLIQNNHQVVWLSREAGYWEGIQKYKWDWKTNQMDENALQGVDVVINLAGAGIVTKAWTKKYKQEILDSRVKSTNLLIKSIQKNNIHLKSFIGASAVGFYGADMSKDVFQENSGAGDDFLANTCKKWENAYKPLNRLTDQFVVIRIGIVLDRNGGAYPKMAMPFKLGIGSALGSGKQLLPWIHLEDLCRMFLFFIDQPSLSGTYNAVSSEIASNRYFSELLANSFKKPILLPNVPIFILKLLLGERHITITRGLIISNQKILNTGFKFIHTELRAVLNQLKNSATT